MTQSAKDEGGLMYQQLRKFINVIVSTRTQCDHSRQLLSFQNICFKHFHNFECLGCSIDQWQTSNKAGGDLRDGTNRQEATLSQPNAHLGRRIQNAIWLLLHYSKSILMDEVSFCWIWQDLKLWVKDARIQLS